jgi:hypothetical protein
VCLSPDYGRKHYNPVGPFEKVATVKRQKKIIELEKYKI